MPVAPTSKSRFLPEHICVRRLAFRCCLWASFARTGSPASTRSFVCPVHGSLCRQNRGQCGFCLLFVATVLLALMCVSLLTNKAAQNMASWTFHGNNKIGAIVGLVLCGSVPVSLFVWERYRSRELERLVEEFPPVDPELDRARL